MVGNNTVTTTVRVNSSDAIAEFNKLGGMITKATALGTVFGNALTGAFGMAVDGAQSLVGAFGDVADTQLSMIGAAGDLAKVTGLGFAESQKDLEDFTNEMSKLATTLPGTSRDFIEIGTAMSDSLGKGLRDANGALDLAAFEEYREKLSVFAGMRTGFSGVEVKDTNLFLSKLLDGRSLAELKTLRFAEQNVGVVAELERQLAETGKDIKELSGRELIELATAAMEVQDEVITASTQSVAGLVAGFKDGLFSPNTGLFGIMRDLDDELDGNQSVFASFTRVIQKVLGEDGLFSKGAKLFDDLGLELDPMQMLADGLGRVGSWIDGVNDWIDSLGFTGDESESGEGQQINFSEILGGAAKRAGTWLSEQFNGAFERLSQMDSTEVGTQLGEGIAGLGNAISNFIKGIDPQKFQEGITNFGKALFIGLGVAIKNINWGDATQALFNIGKMGVLGVAGEMSTQFWEVANTAIEAFNEAKDTAFGAIQNFGNRMLEWIESIGAAFRDAFESAKERALGAFSIFTSGDDGPTGFSGRRIGNRATGLDQMGLFDAIARESAMMPSGSNLEIANSSEAILPRNQVSQLLGALSSNRGGNALNIRGGIHIHAADVSDPKQLARQVLREIDREWRAYGQSAFA